MRGSLLNIFRVEDLRKKILFTLGALFIYRVGYHIFLPGVNVENFRVFAEARADQGVSGLVGLVGALSGGNLNAPVLMSLGILPYITSSIIFSLLVKVVPSLEALSKEGAAGQRRINQYSRLLTVPLCIFQTIAICLALFLPMGRDAGLPVITMSPVWFTVMATVGITTGTVFLMWLGEQMTEYGIGNGVSLLITAGIVAQVPVAFARMLDKAKEDPSYILTAAILAGMYLGVVIAVVYMTKATRRIPIQQAKLLKGRKMYGGARHYLPMKLNMANVMPVIFASTIMVIPSTIATWFTEGPSQILASGGWWWMILTVGLIFFFSYFWTSLMFQPTEMANNLKEYGSFIPGIRPGRKTADFLERVMVRITLVGGAFLAVIAVIPTIISTLMGVDYFVASFLGGTGILIVVGVTLDLVEKINSSLLMRDYEGFMSSSSGTRQGRG